MWRSVAVAVGLCMGAASADEASDLGRLWSKRAKQLCTRMRGDLSEAEPVHVDGQGEDELDERFCLVFGDTMFKSVEGFAQGVENYSGIKPMVLRDTSLSEPYKSKFSERVNVLLEYLLDPEHVDARHGLHRFLSEGMMDWYLGVATEDEEMASKPCDPLEHLVQVKVSGEGIFNDLPAHDHFDL